MKWVRMDMEIGRDGIWNGSGWNTEWVEIEHGMGCDKR